MREWADFDLETDAKGATRLALRGPLRVSSIGDLDRRLAAVADAVAAVDLSQVRGIDTTGAWLAWRVAQDYGAEITGASDEARRLIEAISTTRRDVEPEDKPMPLPLRVVAWTGKSVIGGAEGFYRIVGFLGALLIATGGVILHPSRFRGKALVHQMELVGVTALGIIGLMSFLVGIVIAQQGAEQLKQFGAEVYTVNLTGRLAMRELGILMTAIMVAGRSGSAFAAQIGTMQLTEEVDAMRTIGVSPMEALVIPRVLAAMIMMPLLGFYAAIMAIIGGAFISTVSSTFPSSPSCRASRMSCRCATSGWA